jgi:multiple antibiotic resistance protein
MDTVESFVAILTTLLIIMDPLGNLPLFLLFTKGNTRSQRLIIAGIACVAACLILIFFGTTGDTVLRFFGIGLPAFEIAGGFILFIYSLQMLRLIPQSIKSTIEEEEEGISKANIALVPLATPLLAGPGAITAVLVWQQSADDPLSTPLLAGAIVASCLVLYITFYFAERIHRVLGIGGIRVVERLMGMLLAVIAIQFVVDGIQQM